MPFSPRVPHMTRLLLLTLATLSSIAASTAHASADQAVSNATAVSDAMAQAREAAVNRRYDEAIALYTAMLAANPADADARLARGRTYAWAKRWREAELDLVAVTAASPSYADAWSALGDLYLWTDRPRDAVDAYGRWQALQPERAEPLLARARAHRAAGDADAASRDVDAAVGFGATRPSEPPVDRRATVDDLAGSGFRWSLQGEARHVDFSGDRENWQEHALALRRRFERGSLGLEVLQVQRFGRGDKAVALDAYLDTWARAYANVRYQHSDGGLLPDAWRVELYQGVGQGWELSAGIDQLRFDTSTTDIYSLGIGHYAGNFYLRARSRYSPSSGSTSHQFMGRWYYAGDADDYLEASAGTGRGEEEYRGLLIEDDSRAFALSWMRYVTPRVGFKVGVRHVDAVVDETQLSAGAYLRW